MIGGEGIPWAYVYFAGLAACCSPRGRASTVAVARDMTDRSSAVKRATIVDDDPGDPERRAGVTLMVRASRVSW